MIVFIPFVSCYPGYSSLHFIFILTAANGVVVTGGRKNRLLTSKKLLGGIPLKKRFVSVLALVLALMMLVPSMAFAAPAAADPIGNASFQKNLEKYPGLWNAERGVTQPAFVYENRILEQVFVEAPIDSDEDGHRDLLKVYIYRPAESGKDGVKVPVLLHQSPYISGGNATINEDHVTEQSDSNPSTAHYTYDDVKTAQVQAYDWPWLDEAFEVEDPVFGTIKVPAARGPKPNPDGITGSAASEEPSSRPANNSWKGYLVSSGYAYALAGHLGTRYSEGIPSSCDVDEALALMAVIKWFAGEARGYADQAGTIQVEAESWCNGNVAMEGASYPGTTPLVAAGTGVKNLKAIFPKASVPNWYNYYRQNGALHSPDKYAGEEAVTHADNNFSRNNWLPEGIRDAVKAVAARKFGSMLDRAERATGSYNEFWDQRNLLRNMDMLQKGREDDPLGVIIQHGLNDHNVLPIMSDQLYRAIKTKAPLAPVKIYWHQGIHADIQMYGGLFEWTHKWMDHFLYGIDNNVVEEMPEVSIVNNTTGAFERFDSWPIAGSEYQRIFFNPAAEGSGAGTLALNAPVAGTTGTFKDDLADYTKAVNQRTGNGYQTYAGSWERRALLSWDGEKPDLNAVNTNRLAYVSEPLTEDLRLNGVAKIKLNLTPDKAKGNISAALVEIGSANRPFAYGDSGGSALDLTAQGGKLYTAVPAGSAQANGPSYTLPGSGNDKIAAITAYEGYSLNNTNSEYKFILRAQANVRKPNPTGKIYTDAADTNFIPEYQYQEQEIVAGQAYDYIFEFQPYDYTFKAGQQLAVIVYSTDYRHTIIPFDVTTFTMDLSKSYIDIPFVNNTLKDVDVGLNLSLSKNVLNPGDYVNVAASLTEQVKGNVAVLDFAFDKTRLEYANFSVPAGATLLLSEETAEGRRLVVMVPDYNMTDLVTVMLYAKAEFSGATDIGAVARIVQKDADDVKEVLTLTNGISTIPELGDIDLIELSNAIDAFGKTSFDYDWPSVKKYDLNNNGRIDIQDISELAMKVIL